MSDATSALFISYAHEDAVAADRIAEALRSHGLEVWFDQNELRGGEAWDQKIRGQIRTCSLLIPIISAHTQGRGEGYFRREWKLAAERTHDMAAGIPFLVPVVIDDTAEGSAMVPDEFMRVQWTRLPHGRTTPQFAAQVKRLLETPRAAPPTRPALPIAAPAAAPAPPAVGRRVPAAAWGAAILVAVLVLAAAVWWRAPESAPVPAPNAGARTRPPAPERSAPAPSEKSIAVLPFDSTGTEKSDADFADGIHEDVITNLSMIRDLKVIARPSVLAYRAANSRNLKKISADLGVVNVLVGSVRRSGNAVRVTAQLIDARTEENRWAQYYDGDLTDIFALQSKLAQEIAAAMKATLTTSERALIARRPTLNQSAYDLYLRAKVLEESITPRSNIEHFEQAISLYEQAVAEDSGFALVYPRLAYVNGLMYWFGSLDPSPTRRARTQAARDAAERLAPDSPETHVARGTYAYFVENNWSRALAEYRLAEVNLPNDAQLLAIIGYTHRRLGHWQDAVDYLMRTITLSPHDFYNGTQLVLFLQNLRRFEAARDLGRRCLALAPRDGFAQDLVIRTQFMLDGDRAAFTRALGARAPMDDDPENARAVYELAIKSGDYSAAERALADPRIRSIVTPGGVISEPVELHRALVARLLGHDESARQFSERAIAVLHARRPTPRQEPYALMCVARAEAYGGQSAEALRDARSAVEAANRNDVYAALEAKTDLGRIYVLTDHRDDALAVLRELMTLPANLSPNDFRIDPLWSRLKDDPRFEEILKSAKPL